MARWRLQQLAQFRMVYEHRSVSAAARALGVSQPALSRSLATLEEAVGGALFQRHTRALRATELADLLYRQAVRTLDESAGLDRLVERFHEGREGLVRIGCGPFVPDLIAHSVAGGLRRLGPRVRLEVQSDHFDALCAGLLAYRYDFLIYDDERSDALPDRDDVVAEPWTEFPLNVVAPAAWVRRQPEVARDADAARAFMADHPWALPRVAPEYRRRIAPWFHDLLVARRGAEFQMATLSSCLSLCRAGQAITLAPASLLAQTADDALVVLPLDPGVVVRSHAYRLRSHPLSEASRTVWRLFTGYSGSR